MKLAIVPAVAPYTYENDTLVCKTAKTVGAAFSIDHWKPASNGTTAYMKNLGDSILLQVSGNYDELNGLITQNQTSTDAAIREAETKIASAVSAAARMPWRRHWNVLLLVALGGCFSERSGIINIGLEGIMVIGALGGVMVLHNLSPQLPGIVILLLTVAASIAAGMIYSLLPYEYE